MSSERQPDSMFCVKYARENNLLMIVCVLFVVIIVRVFFCQFVIFVLFSFFRDISPNTYVIEIVGFSDLSMILLDLWKT